MNVTVFIFLFWIKEQCPRSEPDRAGASTTVERNGKMTQNGVEMKCLFFFLLLVFLSLFTNADQCKL